MLVSISIGITREKNVRHATPYASIEHFSLKLMMIGDDIDGEEDIDSSVSIILDAIQI